MPRLPRLLMAVMLAAWAAHTAQVAASPLDNPEVIACAQQSSDAFGVPLELIHLILRLEGGWPGAQQKNKNGSYDLGPMQVNTEWLPRLNKRGVAVTLEDVRDNVCVNVSVGTWLLAHELFVNQRSVAQAVAYYHSPTLKYQQIYLSRAVRILERTVNEESRTAQEDAPASAASAG